MSILSFILTNEFINLKIGFLASVILFLSFQTSDLIFSKKTITYLYLLTLIIIFGAWIGYIYVKLGGAMLFEVANPETKETKIYFFLTTFSNHLVNNEIRPSGLFDEPGSLIFFITFVVIMMELHKFPKYQSLLVLSLSIISNSMVGLLLVTIYVFFYYKKKFMILLPFLLSVLLSLVYLRFTFFDHLLIRFSNLDNLIYNNRVLQVIEFFENVDMKTFLYGYEFSEKNRFINSQTASPFSILWGHGVFLWLPYVLIEFWLIYKFFFGTKSVQFSAMAIFLTLLQRPYIYSMYWGFVIMYPIIVLYKFENQINKRYAK